MASNYHSQGDVYIADLNAGTVEAWYVERDIDDTKNPPIVVWTSRIDTPHEPYYSDAITLVHYYRTAPIGWHKHFDITMAGVLTGTGVNSIGGAYPDKTKNAHDFIDPGVDQNKLTNWAGTQLGTYITGLSMRLANIAADFHLIDQNTVTKVNATVEFDDGSHIDVDIDYSTTNAKTTVNRTSAHDSHSNKIPATRLAATCSGGGDQGICKYSFNGPGNPTDQQNWKNRLTLMGITVSGTATGSAGHWACVSTGSGENVVYSCTFFP